MNTKRSRRGVTLLESLLAGFVLVVIVSLYSGIIGNTARVFSHAQTDADTVTAAQKALQTIARDVRSARSLSKVESESDLTLQLPEFEKEGQIKLPITDGKTVRFHIKNGDLMREEKGSQPETLVRDLEPNGSFVITPSFTDDNKDGVNQPNELKSATIRLLVVRRAQHPGLDRKYDSSITVYLQNSKSVLGKSGETTIYAANTGAGGAESKPPKKKKAKGDSGTPDDPHPPNPGEDGE